MLNLLSEIVGYEIGILKRIQGYLRIDDLVNLSIAFPELENTICTQHFREQLNSSILLPVDSKYPGVFFEPPKENCFYYNCLIFAILEKKPLDFFEKLFELGADPNKTYEDINFGVSPLALAIEHENIGVIGILLDNDADPERPFNWVERQNMTPVSRYNFQECYNCVTALTVAIYSENLCILDMILMACRDLSNSLFKSTVDNYREMLGEARFQVQRGIHEYFRTETPVSIAIGRSGLGRILKKFKVDSNKILILRRIKKEIELLENNRMLSDENIELIEDRYKFVLDQIN